MMSKNDSERGFSQKGQLKSHVDFFREFFRVIGRGTARVICDFMIGKGAEFHSHGG